MPSWIDTHCHLDASEFSGLTLEVRRRAREAEVELCVLPAVEVNNFGRVRQLAHDLGDVYALGIHPLYTGRAADADVTTLATALQAQRDDPRLVALGEIGLDFFVPGLDGARQSHFYEAQLKLARHFELPLILHVRRSADALLRSLRALRPAAGWRGIAHAFNGSQQQAMAFVDLGFKLGFGGAVTFERALQLRRLAASLPPEAIVLETDAPDIPPHWLYRTAAQRAAGQAQGLNQPVELPRIAGVVARLRDVTLEQLARQTSHNAAEALPRLAGLLVPAGA